MKSLLNYCIYKVGLQIGKSSVTTMNVTIDKYKMS